MAKFPLHKDPDANWEAQRYDKPIPSRQYILNALDFMGKPLNELELAEAFGIRKDSQQLDSFSHRLRAMQRDGQLIQNRRGDYGLVAKMHLEQGVVIGHRDGYGFVRLDDDASEDMYLSYRQMRTVFDGDRVLVREKGVDRRGRTVAAIVEVLERSTEVLVGRYYQESGVGFVIPDNRRITHQVLIGPKDVKQAQPGDFVRVQITVPPHFKHQPHGRVLEVLGDPSTSGIETEMALRTFGIPHEWPKDALTQANALAPEVLESDKVTRVDLRELPLVTIDGEDARDFDDAVYCEPTASGGYRLFVAIADVSHYVERGSALDEQARLRGTSVYFPNRVVPMLPERLSNGLCSLNPDVDRLCMVCELRVSAAGKVTRYQFYEGVMCSQARLTYNQVHDYLSGDDQDPSRLPPGLQSLAVRENVEALNGLFMLLKKERHARGAIDFDTAETQVLYDDSGRIDKIVARTRNDAHKIIEECMLLANVAAAKLLQKLEIPALYRIHEQPNEDKLELLNQFLASIGLQFPKRKHLQSRDFQKILKQVSHRPDFSLIQTVMLRSMMQARYGDEQFGHFGLAYPIYTHFTSPIRRYPDLLVHRALRYVIRSRIDTSHVTRVPKAKRLAKTHWLETSARQLRALGEQCSQAERRADEATRDAMDWLKCEYMQARVGNFYDGVISSVTPFGLFIELQDVFVEGLVHVSALDRDYYSHDQVHHRLVGQRTQRAHCLGDRVTVRVVRVDVDERKIDFELIENATLVEREQQGIRFTVPQDQRWDESKRKKRQGGKSSGRKSGQGRGKGGAPNKSSSGRKGGAKSSGKRSANKGGKPRKKGGRR